MSTAAPVPLDPEVVRRARRLVAAAGRDLWPPNRACLAVDRGRGHGVILRWRVGDVTLVSAECVGISIHPRPGGEGAVLRPFDDPDPDLHAVLPDGVVHLVEVNHGLSAVIPLGPPPA